MDVSSVSCEQVPDTSGGHASIRGRATAFHDHVRRHYASASSASPKPHSLHCLHFFACSETVLAPLPALICSYGSVNQIIQQVLALVRAFRDILEQGRRQVTLTRVRQHGQDH